MTHDSRGPAGAEIDPVRVIVPHLAAPEDAIRCAAARALGALADEDAAPALLDTLMDPDPDVRSDAMSALEGCARPQDAAAIRRSLRDDPVADVKVAAIRALRRLEDDASAGLLRALAIDRCESHVAWEPRDEGWDDWLDVQVAAITALGDLRVEDAVDDLVRARRDDTGQDLDHVVFAALANMPGRGVAVLLDVLGDDDPQVRRRALAALSGSECTLAGTVRDRLVRDPDPDVRSLAIESIGEGDEFLAKCALTDPSARVRRTALARVGASRPDIARLALDDPNEGVRATALEALAARTAPGGVCGVEPIRGQKSDITARAEAGLRTGGAPLATTCASVLPRLAGADALHVLREAAGDREKPLEVRVAALWAMREVASDEVIDTLRAAVVDPVRQLRLTALASVGALTRSASDDICRRARAVLIDAISGGLRIAEMAHATGEVGGAPSRGASASGQGPEEGIAASPEVTIVPAAASAPPVSEADRADTGAGDRPYPRSTLEAIGSPWHGGARPAYMSARASGTPDDSRRHALVRPRPTASADSVDIDAEVRIAAIRIAGGCVGDGIEEALVQAAESPFSHDCTAALEAIARGAEADRLSPGSAAILTRSLRHEDSRVRAVAARALQLAHEHADRVLAPLIDDCDAEVRGRAVSAAAATCPEAAMAGFRDPSPLVRRAAVDALVARGRPVVLENGLRMLVRGGWNDTLIDACRRHPAVRRLLLRMLDAPECSRRTILTILDALGHAVEDSDPSVGIGP